ncbi:unnamed protein product [Trichogramma brassicae]|uniref:VWFC domain-containing protein n=1 Tax=Trichogramma brassicae TaxID=86971 RepID=A0A6H5ILD5_9HYME|nr:unnamed protein product [Trichogramma brassicae]
MLFCEMKNEWQSYEYLIELSISIILIDICIEEKCNIEGQPISVNDIPGMRCFDCTCKNGYVVCQKHQCEDIEGCYVLHQVNKNDCCAPCKAKGCELQDQIIDTNTHLVTIDDPCVTCSCSMENINCTKRVCPVLNCPSSKIVHDRDECCPRCLGSGKYLDPPNGDCLLDMQVYRNGSHFILDDCTDCRCTDTVLHCSKQSCPVLRCKREHQTITPGYCCPQCKYGTEMNLRPKPNRVRVGTTTTTTAKTTTPSSNPNKQFSDSHGIDQISNQHTNTLKDTKVFESEDYYDDYVESQNEYEDYAKPLAPSSSKRKANCVVDATVHKSGQIWNTTACQTCKCYDGKIDCKPLMCPAVTCPKNKQLRIPPDQCCPVCSSAREPQAAQQEQARTCTVFGGSHFRSFDGKMYSFIGSCKYQLVGDCDSGTFNVRLKNSVVGNDASMKRISLRLAGARIDLQNNRNTKVNDRIVDLPYKLGKKLDIHETSDHIVIVNSNVGIKVLWDYVGFLEITASKDYRKKLCGLCGNYNSVPDDDLTTREGILVDDPATFAQSWSTDDVCHETRNYGIRGCDPKKDHRLCNYIKGPAFEKCSKRINVAPYYETCLRDMCQCQTDDLLCHCESFANYARDCRRLDILLPKWRKSVGCLV